MHGRKAYHTGLLSEKRAICPQGDEIYTFPITNIPQKHSHFNEQMFLRIQKKLIFAIVKRGSRLRTASSRLFYLF